MLRRSERLKEKTMPLEELPSPVDSADSDTEKTMVEMIDPTLAELKEEILELKKQLKVMSSRSNPTAINIPEPPVGTPITFSMPNTSLPPAAYLHPTVSTTTISSTTPKHPWKDNVCEYKMPVKYYLPLAAQTSEPYCAPQSLAITTEPYYAPQSRVTTSFNNYATPNYAPNFAPATHLLTPGTTMPPSAESVQCRPTQIYSSAQPRMVSATSTNPPGPSRHASLNMHGFQPIMESRQLRKLHDLPQFSGQPEQWPMFIGIYKETTTNYNYTDLENLIRLQKSLVGEARAKIEAFLIHPNSVNQVISTLEFLYGRPHILIRSQLAKVRSFPPVSGRRINDIVNLSTMVSNLSTFLVNANATAHLNNPTLLDELVNKLPMNKREEWVKHSLHHLGLYPNIHDFSVWLQEVATYVALSFEADSGKGECAFNKKEKINPSFTIVAEDNQLTNCSMCHQHHHLYHCQKFKELPVNGKWQLVKEKHLCFGCLRAGHSSNKCKNRRLCGLSNCNKYHNRLLHERGEWNRDKGRVVSVNDNTAGRHADNSNDRQVENITQRQSNAKEEPNRGNNESSVNTITENSLDRGTLFKYLRVELTGPKGKVRVVAFIDEGSKITLLENGIANEIGLQGTSSNLCLGWIGGKTSKEVSKSVNMEIKGIGDDCHTYHMRNVWTTANLKLPPQNLQVGEFRKIFPILERINIEDYSDARPKLLIGLPHINLVRPSKVFNLDGCFALHETSLGNIIFGSNEDSVEATVCRIDVDILNDIHRQVFDFFTLENLGIKVVEPVVSNDDKRAKKMLYDTTVKKGLHFETGLLWKHDKYEYKDTYPVALKRLYNMEAKMKKDKGLEEWYKNKINEYVFKSYARKLSPHEAAVKNSRTWYLPHFVVHNLNKENKRRLVFDAAACVDGESFNTRLMKGPSEYQPKSLLSILFRFRQRKIGVCADIREMFHRVKIRDEDQTAQRFLWRCNETDRQPDEYVMEVMIFGSVSSPCSAQFVKNLNAESYEKTHPEAYRAIIDSHYVDDYVDSFNDVNEAIIVSKDVVEIHRQAGFELRGFVSNSTEFLAEINEDKFKEDDLALARLCENEASAEKVLGMRWKQSDDTFCFVLKFSKVPKAVLTGERKPTKSEMLSLTMSIYDPFGFLANIVIKSKILLQELWRSKVDWETPIPDGIYNDWYSWYKSLYVIHEVKVARCYDQNLFLRDTVVDLHIFVDASEVAFAAAAYWRIICNNEVNIVFVAGKSRCSPLKPLSIPRLELQAAVLGVRLKESVLSCHDIKPRDITFWSDSKTVIKWIHSDCRTYKQFVAHRIAEILELSGQEQWRWVPGSLNPADEATRPQNFSRTFMDSLWLNGPLFLKAEEDSWPQLPNDIDQHGFQEEMRSKFVSTIYSSGNSLIQFERFSSFNKLLRTICWVRRAVKMFKSYGVKQGEVTAVNGQPLNAKEIAEAENYLYKTVQRDVFLDEFNQLKRNKPIHKSSPIFKLSPFLSDDGLIRLSGRINNATCVARSTKEPIILPKQHILTKLVVKQFHENYKHQNQESICAAIRIKYWIPSLRQLVRSAKRSCQICKNMSAVPRPPLMGQHPEDRLTPYVRAFSYTGADYIGPFTVSIGRRQEKRWVAIFTCLTVRAIHLEIARDLSTDAVILCIKNFINRRGLPVRIRSDRGTNFVGASNVEFVLNEEKLVDECSKRGIEWLFNTPANPSAGGAWERMVRSVKNVLYFTMKQKAPQVETFNSLLIEAENLINSRPLTHIPIENSECEPLTPNHFLIGCPNILQTPGVPEKVCLRKQWHIVQQLKQTFWKRWIQEYLPELTRRTKWHQPVKPIQVGDVVIICDDNETRGQWKKGLVEEVFRAADGQVRSAVVKTTIGKLRRPASKLAVLDIGGVSP